MNIITEGSSGRYTVAITGPNGEPVTKAMLTGLTLTYYDYATSAIINSRDNQDVLDTNDVTVASNGTITWDIQPEDAVIVNPNLKGRIERHIALFTLTWVSGRKTHEVIIGVQNFVREPVV